MYVVSSRIFLNEQGLCWINRFHQQHPESLALFIRAFSRIKVILVYLGLSCEIHRSSNHWHRFRQVIGPRKCFCNHMWPQLSVRQNHVIQSFCILNLTLDLFRICGYRISTVSVCLNSTVIFFFKNGTSNDMDDTKWHDTNDVNWASARSITKHIQIKVRFCNPRSYWNINLSRSSSDCDTQEY